MKALHLNLNKGFREKQRNTQVNKHQPTCFSWTVLKCYLKYIHHIDIFLILLQ